MIVVRLELVSAQTGEVTNLGVAEIANDGKGTADVGNYEVRLFQWGPGRKLWRKGQVEGFPRKAFGPWDLLCIGVAQALGAERLGKLVASRGAEPEKATDPIVFGDDEADQVERF